VLLHFPNRDNLKTSDKPDGGRTGRGLVEKVSHWGVDFVSGQERSAEQFSSLAASAYPQFSDAQPAFEE
jgi:hypothetical protein